jgi:pimeloyl-ACP methyl ester carboxylesterase
VGAQVAERLVRVSDSPHVELFVSETSGPADRALLVIHGGPDWDHTYLREPLVRLADRHRVVFMDLRGCGRSTRGLPASAHTPTAAVQDLVALVDHLDCASVDVLGFSYGGQLAQRLIVAAPGIVRRTIIASSSILPVTPDLSTAHRTGVDSSQDRSHDGDERTRQDAVTSAETDIWQRHMLPEYLARLAQVQFSSDWSRAWPDRTALPPARPDDVVRRLREIGTPLLLLHGRHDATFPVSLIEPTLAVLPHARAVVLDDAAHMAHIDQPHAWLRAVRDFLDIDIA